MNSIPYILATAGHVDHGKSAMVRALTGTDPDRLPEEKARGITIDLGFAELSLPAPAYVSPACSYQVSIVDVPGHEDYVRNMVAGVGSVDAALLIVAADDGWMPQTEEHLQILSYLGVTRAVVALTKIDLANDEAAAVAGVREQLGGTALAGAAVVPTSVVSGRGIEQLKEALAQLLAHTPPRADLHKPRLPIDRVFVIKGAGTVVTGTLVDGSLSRGQAVMIQPQALEARIRSMQTHSRSSERVMPGSRVALNLPAVTPAASSAVRSSNSVARGDVVTLASLGPATRAIDVQLDRSARANVGPRRQPPLRSGTIVRLHHGTSSIVARLRLLDGHVLESGSTALARLTLESPILALAGDRFILRDSAQQQTLAGGVVLDALPTRGRRNSPTGRGQRALLAARACSPHDVGVCIRSQLTRDGVATRAVVFAISRFSEVEIEAAIAQVAAAGALSVAGDLLLDAQLLAILHANASAAVDAYHRAHPERGYFPLTDFRVLVTSLLTTPVARQHAMELSDIVARALAANEFIITSAGLRRASHEPALPPRLQPAGAVLRRRLSEGAFDPPSRQELCRTDLAQQAMRFLIAAGEAVEAGPDVVVSADAYRRAVALVRERLTQGGPATVSQLKTLLASSRRVMVPLLERLDRDGITRRQGDVRVLRSDAQGR